MPTNFLMLPPQSETTREWARRLAEAAPELDIIAPETMEGAEQAIGMAEGAFGRIPPALLARADMLRWLQAPQAAPPAGFYYRELIEHPVVITNMREIYNDHIGAHVMAFVLAFARGLQVYLPQQQRREWRPVPRESGDVVHLPEATALVVGVGGIGAEVARLPRRGRARVAGCRSPSAVPRCFARRRRRLRPAEPGHGSARGRRTAPRRRARRIVAARRFRDPDRAAHARDRGLHEPRAVSAHEEGRLLH